MKKKSKNMNRKSRHISYRSFHQTKDHTT